MSRKLSNVNDRLDAAIEAEQDELKHHPTHPDWRLCRRNQSWIVAETLLRSGDHGAAAHAAAEMVRDCGEQAQDCYDAACLMARCAALAMNDQHLAERDRARLARSYAGEAVRFLRLAIRNGFQDVGTLGKDPDLEPLKAHRAFAGLVALVKGHSHSKRL